VKTRFLGFLVAAVTTVGSAAWAQEPQVPAYDQSMGQPPASMPEPPPPPQYQEAAPAPAYAPTVTVASPAADGQWVYTNQYGWVWMPYGANYTYVAGPGVAYSYTYYPRFGWRWVSAPWVIGYGPSPFWGRLGPSRFAWYGHPGFRGYAHGGWSGRPVFRSPVAHVAWHGGGFHGGGFHGGGFHGGGHFGRHR
jgi:hypothetical protein